MKKYKYIIVGAGIGGLSAGAELKNLGETDFVIFEKSDSLPRNMHNGLHYLHSIDFGTPFPFGYRKNKITEEIWDTKTNSFYKSATLPDAIAYSKKTMESKRHATSILDPGKLSEVYVPQDNDMNSLINAYYNYIGEEHFKFKHGIESVSRLNKSMIVNGSKFDYDFLITTAPLDKWYAICNITCPYELKHKELYITNFKNDNIDPSWLIVLYMSDPKFPPHRITAMNGILSMESMRELSVKDDIIIQYLIGDLFDYDLDTKSSYCWETGRIFGLDKNKREEISNEFAKNNIYLLGRFANWNGKIRIDDTIIQAKEIINKIYGK